MIFQYFQCLFYLVGELIMRRDNMIKLLCWGIEVVCTGEDKEVGRSHRSDTHLALDDSNSLDMFGVKTQVCQ